MSKKKRTWKKNKHLHTLTNYNSNIDNNESETNGVT